MLPTYKKNAIFFIYLFCIIVFSFSFCKKDNNNAPGKFVDIYVDIRDPYFSDLNAVGGWVYITGGVRGIILYRRSNMEFIAYDRYCTYEPNDPNAVVKVDSTNIIISDPQCGSKFLITDGSVSNAPATLPLKAYATTFDGSVIHIFN